MRVLILGDVHGRFSELATALRQAQVDYRVGAAIQVGDFGFHRNQWAAMPVRFPVPLHVIDGNHEDHPWLRRVLQQGQAALWQHQYNLIYQPRPSVAMLDGTRIGFLGGALHVDRPQQHSLLAGWPNYILRRQVDRALELFNREKPALLVTHSCPAGIGIGLCGADQHLAGVQEHIRGAGFDPGPRADCGEVELRRLWEGLSYQPQAWVFGHFHQDHQAQVNQTVFACVSGDLSSPNRRLVLWDTREQKLLRVPADPSA